MSRHPFALARARRLMGAGAVGTGIFALVLAGAYAQEAPARPVIDHAPAKVAFGKTVVIGGRLEDGSAGDLVALERRRPSGSWTAVRTAAVDRDLKVRFRVKGVKKSARYRLQHNVSSGASTVASAATSATSNGVGVRVAPKLTVRVRPARVMAGNGVRVRGHLRPTSAGRRVTIARRAGGGWRTVARPRVKAGRYSTRFLVSNSTRSRIKVAFRGDAINTGATRTRKFVVYDPDLASWYGPGLYGNRTACGQTLGYDTMGVAHRTLPCGTKVGILYKGRSITVPVIDRGPYGSAEWDLTRGAAARLRFSGHGTVGTVH
jgi:rare lipoprotein A